MYFLLSSAERLTTDGGTGALISYLKSNRLCVVGVVLFVSIAASSRNTCIV